MGRSNHWDRELKLWIRKDPTAFVGPLSFWEKVQHSTMVLIYDLYSYGQWDKWRKIRGEDGHGTHPFENVSRAEYTGPLK